MENPSNLPRAVQILSPVDHCFQLKLNDLESILNADDIKDRRIVVVSIAGAFRKGKSFLMNFFLKYLYAQYKKCDVSDWIGINDSENANRVQIGFKSRGGRQPETTGIWMWSDIFTHDENLAIILLDTQGIFDNQSSVKDCTTIFALSTLLSSVQCFNLMQNIQEDDLQHLELFTNYGKLVLGQSNEKPFQQLIFVVRDSPHACETGYGWSGRNVIEEVLAENSDQTSEMQQLRSQIKSSFEEISAFLMPFPGTTVQQGGFTGDLQQIDPEFVKYIEELVPAIFAPDKLFVKKINGHELRARDFAKYLQSYTDIFNGDKLPEPKTVLMATAETSYLILQNECMNFYVDFMEGTFDKTETYFDEMELKNIHQRALDGAMSKFDEKRKLGGKKMISKLQRQIKKSINDKFDVFTQKNQVKLEDFIKKAKWHNKNVITEIKTSLVKCVCDEINNTELNLTRSHLQTVFGNMQKIAMEQFEREKIGIDEISDEFREELKHGLDKFGTILFEIWDVYYKSVVHYNNSLVKIINDLDGQNTFSGREYTAESELDNLHQVAQNKAMAQFEANTKCSNHKEIAISFERRVESEIKKSFRSFQRKNEEKRLSLFQKFNENLCSNLLADFLIAMEIRIKEAYLDDFSESFDTIKKKVLQEFNSKKKGDIRNSYTIREKLKQAIDEVKPKFKEQYDLERTSGIKKILVGAAVGATSFGLVGLRFGILSGAGSTIFGALYGAVHEGLKSAKNKEQKS